MSQPFTVIIRCLASARMGLGHLMRSAGLAQTLRARGHPVHWILNEGARAAYAQLQSQDPVDWVAEPAQWSAESSLWSRKLKEYADAVILLDGYEFDAAYRQSVWQLGRPLVLFDDGVLQAPIHASLVIHSSIEPGDEGERFSAVARVLIGARYAPVRPEFPACRPLLPLGERAECLALFGGSDVAGLSLSLVEALPDLNWPASIPVRLITGPAYPDPEHLDQTIARLGVNVIHEHKVRNMATRMRQARLAISAAGSSLWELGVMQVPTVALVVADNQEQVLNMSGPRGFLAVHDAREGIDWSQWLPACLRYWQELAAPSPALEQRLQRWNGWCDGQGLVRIADAMEALVVPRQAPTTSGV